MASSPSPSSNSSTTRSVVKEKEREGGNITARRRKNDFFKVALGSQGSLRKLRKAEKDVKALNIFGISLRETIIVHPTAMS